ncbi:hypothetical protein ACSU64_17630 [Bacillaceae bacterium C204]|uniref:hypothetical protein n=1 Tax=Neobacillus sp. 204 TaxID=3383351 RepID=UPI00397D776A
MMDTTKYVSLDVSKEKITVAIAEEGRGEPRSFGMIPPHRDDLIFTVQLYFK